MSVHDEALPGALTLPGRMRTRRPHAAMRAAVILACAALAVFAATTDGFVTVDNLRAVLTSMVFVGIVAVGMTLIMLSGNLFSMSLGTTTALGAMMFLYALQWGLVTAVAMTLVLGGLVGAVQGFFVGAFGANPIIVTIGAGSLQQGIAVWLSHGHSVSPPADATSYEFLSRTFLGLPFPVFVLAALVPLLEFVLRRTRFGQELYLVGENARAARAGAIDVTRIVVTAFAGAGVCAVLAGILVGSFNRDATVMVSGTYTFDAIAAALVGGNSIAGGRGSVVRTIVGAFVIALISDLLLLRGYAAGVRTTTTGALVLLVVVGSRLTARGDAPR